MRTRRAVSALAAAALLTVPLVSVSPVGAALGPALTQSTTPGLACLSSATSECGSEPRFAADATMALESAGADAYALLADPGTDATHGELVHLRRTAGTWAVADCQRSVSVAGCTTEPAVGQATALAVAPTHVYVGRSVGSSPAYGTVVEIARDAATGALGAVEGCWTAAPSMSGCVTGQPLLRSVTSLALTSTGVVVSVTGTSGADAHAVSYDRSVSGALVTPFVTCLGTVDDADGCTSLVGPASTVLTSPVALDLSDDGGLVDLAVGNGITTFALDAVAGGSANDLALASCVHATASGCGSFPTNVVTPTGLDHHGTTTVMSALSVGPPYVDAVVSLHRGGDGHLTVVSCLSATATSGCTTDAQLAHAGQPVDVVVADGVTYVSTSASSLFTGGVVALPTSSTGTLTNLPGTRGCLIAATATSDCASGLAGAAQAAFMPLALTDDGTSLLFGTRSTVGFLTPQPITETTPPTPGVGTPRTDRTLRPDKHRTVGIAVTCVGQTSCQGSLTLRSAKKIPVRGKSKVVTFGSATFHLTAGATTTDRIRLSKANVGLITALGKIKAQATVTTASTPMAIRSARTTLKPRV